MLSIGQMARTYGVSLRTLRFYEENNLIKPMRSGNFRLYSHDQEVRFQVIQKSRKLGLTVNEIKTFFEESNQLGNQPNPDNMLDYLSASFIKIKLDELINQRLKVDAALEELRSALSTLPADPPSSPPSYEAVQQCG